MTPPTDSISSGSISALIEAYEAARGERGPVPLGEFLPPREDPLFLPALAELLRVEIEYAWAAGEPRPLDEYRHEFPELFADHERLQGVAFEEYRQRRLAGQQVTPSEYRDAYGVDVAGWPEAAPLPRTERTQAFHGSRGRTDFRLDLPAEFPQVGDEFVGFKLLAELGRGAFGRVFFARQGDLAGRPVALKVSRDAYRESQTLARLQHTNIMPIHSVHRAGPFQAVCMPYFPSVTLAEVAGGLGNRETAPGSAVALMETLRDQSRRGAEELPTAPPPTTKADALWEQLRGRGSVDAVIWIGAKLADGLAHAHERGIVHRDLKPANVLLTDEGQPLILDFNLADDPHRPAGERAFLGGTLPYMAPELLRNYVERKPHADPRGDVYALGVILFELLAGRRPFPDRGGAWQGAIEKMIVDRTGPAPELRPHNRGVTPALEAIVRKCLDPDPAQRYPTARELAEDMHAQFEYRPLVHQREPSLRERAVKFSRRHPGLFSATHVGIAAALVIIALAVGGVIWKTRHDRLAAELKWREFRTVTPSAWQTGHLSAKADRRQIDENVSRLRRLLSGYGAESDPDWLRRAEVRRLPAAEQAELRRETGDLLFLLAGNVANQAERATDGRAPDLYREAALLNDRAAETFGADAPRVVWLQREQVARKLNDADGAQKARHRAESTPLRGARDYLMGALLPSGGDASAFLEEAERRGEPDPYFWFRLGINWRDAGRLDRARACFTISLGFDADQPWTWAARGEVRMESDLAGALADFDHALETPFEDSDHVRRNRALAHERAGDFAGAEADLSALIEAHPERVELLRQRSRVRGLKGDPDGAKQDMAALLASQPQSAAGWVARADSQSDAKAALADLDAALALEPDDFEALQHKAKVLERLNKPREAVEALTHAIQKHPDAIAAWAGRAVLRARLGEREAALADARATLKRNPDPMSIYQAANTYALTSTKAQADRREALRLLVQALRRDPKLLEMAANDPDFAPLKNDPDFRAILEAARLILK